MKFEKQGAFPGQPAYERLIQREDTLYSRPDDIRSPFARDYTRVLHSLAYRRLKHKTQVFFNAAGNDHICTRIEHVSHVESVSTTIASELGLNVELTRAIAIAHDLGHAPFGHEGERVLSALSEQYLQEKFWHEKNGVYFADEIELLEDVSCVKRNLDLTYAVRDGIISHCGEVDQNGLHPREELFDLSCFREAGQYNAATWEGCIVKMADKIAYLGRDIEDAGRLGFFTEEQRKFLTDMARVQNQKAINTTVIMHNMIIDLCENSNPDDGICLSRAMAEQLDAIKRFNYQVIYTSDRLFPYKEYSKLVLNQIFRLLREYYRGTETIRAFDPAKERLPFVREFLDWICRYTEADILRDEDQEVMRAKYQNHKPYHRLEDEKEYIRAILDFIAGMTDSYAVQAFEQMLNC